MPFHLWPFLFAPTHSDRQRITSSYFYKITQNALQLPVSAFFWCGGFGVVVGWF